MCISGLNHLQDPNPARTMIQFAAELMQVVHKRQQSAPSENERVRVRMGLSTGSVAAGILGKFRRKWTVMGDCVNCASRLESLGQPMCLHLTRECAEEAGLPLGKFTPQVLTPKGLGEIQSFILTQSDLENMLGIHR